MTDTTTPTIHELVLAIINDPTSKIARQQLYKHVKQARFFLAVYGIPLDMHNALNQQKVFKSEQLQHMPIQLAVTDSGSKALLAYLDTETLAANAPNHWVVEVSGSDLLNLVLLNPEFDAAVLKGNMGWAGIAKEDAHLLMKGYAA